VTREEPAFISPNVPTTGLLNVLSNYNHFDMVPYLDFVKYLGTPAAEVHQGDMVQSELAKVLRPKQYSEWLWSLLLVKGGVPTFRGLRTPVADDLSLLARCIRFAKSRAEEHACWAVHPRHIMLICEYTNNYGISPDQDELRVSSRGSSLFHLKACADYWDWTNDLPYY
jgi:hypothetical protein